MRASRWLIIAALSLVVSLGATTSVFAQGSGEQGGTKDADAEKLGGPLGDDLERYWSVDREVDVVKRRLYEREGRFTVGLAAGLSSSQPFNWYIPVGARLGYHFTNQWGIELEGTFMDASPLRNDTDLSEFLGERADYDSATDAMDLYKWRAHALAVWSPLYGKLALLQRKLSHFDLNLAAGLGAVSVQRPNETRTETVDKVLPELTFGGGVQFFASNHWVIRATGRAYVHSGPLNYKNTQTGDRVVSQDPSVGAANYKELNVFQKLSMNTEFLLGVNYIF